jgi:GrpB-like predicted nucleotidyltransferase (UPF0157 family)
MTQIRDGNLVGRGHAGRQCHATSERQVLTLVGRGGVPAIARPVESGGVADQLVEVADYDPAWPDMFADQQARVAAILAPWLAAPIEHIGSTSVPGLPAKPVIDMLAQVRSLTSARDAVKALTEDGWLFWPDDPCRSYRMWFLRPRPEARTHHLQLIQHDEPHARALIAFRDALRADPGLRVGYAHLKKRLSSQHRRNRNAYTNAKDEFVAHVLHTAGADPPPRASLPE